MEGTTTSIYGGDSEDQDFWDGLWGEVDNLWDSLGDKGENMPGKVQVKDIQKWEW